MPQEGDHLRRRIKGGRKWSLMRRKSKIQVQTQVMTRMEVSFQRLLLMNIGIQFGIALADKVDMVFSNHFTGLSASVIFVVIQPGSKAFLYPRTSI
jgi:hypothetical protein